MNTTARFRFLSNISVSLSATVVVKAAVLASLIGILLIGVALYLPRSLMVEEVFLAANDAAWKGSNPYVVTHGFFTPPQIFLLLTPLSWLPVWLASAAFRSITLLALVLLARSLHARPIAFAAFMLSPLTLQSYLGNIDALALLGIALPAPVGIWLVLLKPQLGWPVALFWFVQMSRRRDSRQLLLTFAPIMLFWIVSLVPFGLWFLRGENLVSAVWNYSAFPLTIPFGVLLLAQMFFLERLELGPVAGLSLSPYLGPDSLIALIAPLLRHDRLMAIVCALAWGLLLSGQFRMG